MPGISFEILGFSFEIIAISKIIDHRIYPVSPQKKTPSQIRFGSYSVDSM